MQFTKWTIVIGVALVVSVAAHAYLDSIGISYPTRLLFTTPISILVIIGMRLMLGM